MRRTHGVGGRTHGVGWAHGVSGTHLITGGGGGGHNTGRLVFVIVGMAEVVGRLLQILRRIHRLTSSLRLSPTTTTTTAVTIHCALVNIVGRLAAPKIWEEAG